MQYATSWIVSCIFMLSISITTKLPTVNAAASRNVTLGNPIVTNWGKWGPYEFCPYGQFVIGMQLKTEHYQGAFSDDSALNGIKFFCDAIGKTTGTDFITSKVGDSGEYGHSVYCNGVVTGFQLLSEKNLGAFNDDTAASNLRIFCDGKVKQGDGETWGTWTEAQICPAELGICGLSTQVEDPNSDDTGLNNLQVQCCPVPDPSIICTPHDTWDLILECDNSQATSPTTCTYERKVGASSWSMVSESNFLLSEIYSNMGFTIPGALLNLPGNFESNLGWSVSTGYNWTSSSSEIWSEQTTITVSIDVPSGIKTQLSQTFGKCDFYSVRANIIKRVDTNAQTKDSRISYIEFSNRDKTEVTRHHQDIHV